MSEKHLGSILRRGKGLNLVPTLSLDEAGSNVSVADVGRREFDMKNRRVKWVAYLHGALRNTRPATAAHLFDT